MRNTELASVLQSSDPSRLKQRTVKPKKGKGKKKRARDSNRTKKEVGE